MDRLQIHSQSAALEPFTYALHRLGISERTARRWRAMGQGFPCYRIGGELRVDPVELEAWIAKRREGRTAE